jgi:hypothetical protein
VAQNKGDIFLSAEIGEPILSEDTLDSHNQTLTIGGNGLEKGFRSGFHIAVHKYFSLVAQDADIHGAGMQVDTTVKLVLVGVESHEVSSSLVSGFFPKASIPLGYAGGEASIIIKALHLTASSLRFAPASGSR